MGAKNLPAEQGILEIFYSQLLNQPNEWGTAVKRLQRFSNLPQLVQEVSALPAEVPEEGRIRKIAKVSIEYPKKAWKYTADYIKERGLDKDLKWLRNVSPTLSGYSNEELVQKLLPVLDQMRVLSAFFKMLEETRSVKSLDDIVKLNLQERIDLIQKEGQEFLRGNLRFLSALETISASLKARTGSVDMTEDLRILVEVRDELNNLSIQDMA